MPNYELGFGSPFYTNQPNGDMGFGAPYSITVGSTSYSTTVEQGFGDLLEVVVSILGGDQIQYGDEGGHILRLKGDWRSLFPIVQLHAGPFIVSVVSSEGVKYECYSGLPGFPNQTWANNLGNEIQAILPSGLDHGLYDIRIEYGINFNQKIEILAAIQIGKGLRDNYVTNLKANMPQFYNLGIRSDFGGKIQNEYDNNTSNISKLLSSIGEELSTIISAKYTILSNDVDWGDTTLNVESTHTYPSVGLIKVGQQEFIYTSKTPTSFNLSNRVLSKIPKYTSVVLLDNDISKIDNYYLRSIYNYNKPSSFTIKNDIWDNTFRYLQFSDRHVTPNIYNYFSSLTSQYDWRHDCVLADANNQVFIILDPTHEFNTSHVDRFVEIDNIVYYSEGLVDTAHISDPEITVKGLKLIKVSTTMFRAASFSNFSNVYDLRVKPFNITIDNDAKFQVEYESTIFPVSNGFIDLNYIDAEEVGIYLDDKNSIGERNSIEFFVAGVKGNIVRKRKTNENFGTYIIPSEDPNFVGLEPDNEIT